MLKMFQYLGPKYVSGWQNVSLPPICLLLPENNLPDSILVWYYNKTRKLLEKPIKSKINI